MRTLKSGLLLRVTSEFVRRSARNRYPIRGPASAYVGVGTDTTWTGVP